MNPLHVPRPTPHVPHPTSMSLTHRIKQKALDLGFDLIGIAPAEQAPHAEAYRRWLANNYHANMHWPVTQSGEQTRVVLSKGRR